MVIYKRMAGKRQETIPLLAGTGIPLDGDKKSITKISLQTTYCEMIDVLQFQK